MSAEEKPPGDGSTNDSEVNLDAYLKDQKRLKTAVLTVVTKRSSKQRQLGSKRKPSNKRMTGPANSKGAQIQPELSPLSRVIVKRLKSIVGEVGFRQLSNFICVRLKYCPNRNQIGKWIKASWKEIEKEVKNALAVVGLGAAAVAGGNILWAAGVLVLALILRGIFDELCACNRAAA